jgi:hypothetical protein
MKRGLQQKELNADGNNGGEIETSYISIAMTTNVLRVYAVADY